MRLYKQRPRSATTNWRAAPSLTHTQLHKCRPFCQLPDSRSIAPHRSRLTSTGKLPRPHSAAVLQPWRWSGEGNRKTGHMRTWRGREIHWESLSLAGLLAHPYQRSQASIQTAASRHVELRVVLMLWEQGPLYVAQTRKKA